MMTKTSRSDALKKLAKHHARSSRTPQAKALDQIAVHLGFSHWGALKAQEKKGWQPTDECIASLKEAVEGTNPFTNGAEGSFGTLGANIDGPQAQKSGTIDGVPYLMFVFQDDIHMEGEGWRIVVPEAPNASPILSIDERFSEECRLNEPKLLSEALAIAEVEAKKVQARISSDWSRRSTKPNAKGVVRHPLFNEMDGRRIESDTWYCLHCNSKVSGHEIAKNLWHCPSCGASPLDIFSAPFWLEESDDQPTPYLSPKKGGRGEPVIEVVDNRLRLELSEDNVTLLIRSALLEDATNVGERLGALLAEISFDDDLGVWVTFETDYWPEEKEAIQARAVAKALGVSFDQDIVLCEPPFAWPGFAEFSSNTLDYTQTMLRAYEEQSKGKAKPAE